ncbi:SAP domain-containing protein [Staphylococcus pasteuri]|uniref:SAP domain-containing protein n=1 Tax=Staphylococcus pasteuri TaxID=45972 RepID=UPI001E393BB6|nr:SAP domain-containing protein [Staphylococcus pasteuri]MCD9066800.1 SAP domain-containing protein [Staphylococcus pasteuri]WAE41685.1 SAP domain-containing protein [Staphylococcus pasteuri]
MKKIIYWFLLIFSVFMIFGGISEVSQNRLTFIDIFMFAIFTSLIVFSIIKLFKPNQKHLNYGKHKSNNTHKVKSISNSEISQFNSNAESNSHDNKNEIKNNIENTNTKNNQTIKQEYPVTNSNPKTLYKDEMDWNENTQKNNEKLVGNLNDNTIDNNISDLNANDILVLHLNKNREVGKEIKHHNYLLENQILVDKILNKLINLNYLKVKSNFEVSLPYFKVPELKDILRKNKLKLSGNKPDLIERIKSNLDEKAIELPQIYIPTAKGNRIIDETKYILHFYNSPLISLGSAHKIANEILNIDDKIEYIYLYLLKQSQKSINSVYKTENIVSNLVFYYKKTNKDKNVIRKYTNYDTYLSVSQAIHSVSFLYSDEENVIDRLFIYFNYHLDYYENMLFIDNVSRSLFKKLFYEDISSFEEIDKNFCDDICELLFAQIYNNKNIMLDDYPIIKYMLEKNKKEYELKIAKYKF